jgi:hypothetical protein
MLFHPKGWKVKGYSSWTKDENNFLSVATAPKRSSQRSKRSSHLEIHSRRLSPRPSKYPKSWTNRSLLACRKLTPSNASRIRSIRLSNYLIRFPQYRLCSRSRRVSRPRLNQAASWAICPSWATVWPNYSSTRIRTKVSYQTRSICWAEWPSIRGTTRKLCFRLLRQTPLKWMGSLVCLMRTLSA